jgi:diguanylate cyclase (GGDEF)-like protein/PAS domain S-box-containing protein
MKERFILVLIEDLTAETKQLVFQHEHEEALQNEIALRKGVEEALRESEKKYRLVVENAREVIFVVQEGKIVFANAEGISRSGYSEKELLNKSYVEFVHPDDREVVAERYANRLMGFDVPEAYSMRILYRDGNFWWGYFNMLVIDWKGEPAVLAFGTDISELKKTEEHLRESEERFRSIFSNSHAVMFIIDPKTGAIEDANPAASNFYGYADSELTSMKITDINTLTSDQVFKELQQAKLQQRNYFNFRHRLANGEIRDVEVYSGPIIVQGREVLYSIIHDITERKHLEAELQKLATTDSLTEAYNRQHFMNKGQDEFLRSQRYNRPLSVLMIDIDRFKSINDTYGHHTGDLALIAMVKECKTILRRTDILGRLGGEEFGIILTETAIDGALRTAERMRRDLELLTVPATTGAVGITVSIGLTSINADDVSLEKALQRADKALYEAKRRGRNCVVKAE